MDYIILSGSRSHRASNRFSFLARVLTVLIVLSMAGCATVAFAGQNPGETEPGKLSTQTHFILP